MKYLGFVFRAIPKIIARYPRVNRNYHQGKKLSFTKRYNDARELIDVVDKALHMEFIVTGEYPLPVTPSFLLTPNHQSFLDSLTMINIMNQPCSFVAKKEAKKYPIVGKVLSSIDGYFMDRDDLRQEMKIMQKVRASIKEENKKWIIFPEGTRTKDKDKKVGAFKPGSFKMAMANKVNIYPVAMWGSFRVLDRKVKMKKYPIYVHFCSPVTPEIYEGKSTTEVSELVRNSIIEQLEILKEIDKTNLKNFS